ncbi:MAG TPA: hypothetical protein VKT19_06290 [Steroidobacteraceae bacterium]|nr:hypothetical protein [Steroidobacteraceae bacterium]
MNRFRTLSLVAGAALALSATARPAHAQIAISIGEPPACPYGYYDFAPYECAPYGYYGPEWFVDGVFIGAGPWFHGRREFRGHVDNRFDPHYGYRGPRPARGERAERSMRDLRFHGNEMRDGRGHGDFHGDRERGGERGDDRGGHDEHGGDHDHH